MFSWWRIKRPNQMVFLEKDRRLVAEILLNICPSVFLSWSEEEKWSHGNLKDGTIIKIYSLTKRQGEHRHRGEKKFDLYFSLQILESELSSDASKHTEDFISEQKKKHQWTCLPCSSFSWICCKAEDFFFFDLFIYFYLLDLFPTYASFIRIILRI